MGRLVLVTGTLSPGDKEEALSDSVWVVEEVDWRRNPTGQHALVHDAGSLNERGVARHDHPIGRDDDDVAGHELRGHGLVNVWGAGSRGQSQPVKSLG